MFCLYSSPLDYQANVGENQPTNHQNIVRLVLFSAALTTSDLCFTISTLVSPHLIATIVQMPLPVMVLLRWHDLILLRFFRWYNINLRYNIIIVVISRGRRRCCSAGARSRHRRSVFGLFDFVLVVCPHGKAYCRSGSHVFHLLWLGCNGGTLF